MTPEASNGAAAAETDAGTAPALDRATIVPFLAELFASEGGAAYLGEDVTMAEHMLQAAHAAERRGADETVIAAALVHDIGHFTGAAGRFAMTDTADRHHEQAGADLLAPFFPPRAVACVRAHVPAKRYLCATDPAYAARLSPASVHSLELQGGAMSAEEATFFATDPDLDAILTVRRCDDEAKVAGARTPDFAHYAPLLQRVVDANAASR